MWKKCEKLEKDIILSIQRKPLSITEIAKKVKRTKSTVSETIKRLVEQKIITKTHTYRKDARKTEINLNLKRIKIEKTHRFYFYYFTISFIPFIFILIFSFVLKNFFLILGASVQILPALLFILYEVYVKEDKITVYKNPKIIKKEIQKKPENLFGATN